MLLSSSFTTGMVSLILSLRLYISRSIKQLQVYYSESYIYALQTQKIHPDAYHRAGVSEFQCMFLFVTKR